MSFLVMISNDRGLRKYTHCCFVNTHMFCIWLVLSFRLYNYHQSGANSTTDSYRSDYNIEMWGISGWSDGIHKRMCRFLIHRYFGHLLKSKLSLEQLSIDLYNGTARIQDVNIDVQVCRRCSTFIYEYISSLSTIQWIISRYPFDSSMV